MRSNKKKLIIFLLVILLIMSAASADIIKSGQTNYFQAWNGGYLQGTIDWRVYQGSDSYTEDTGFDAPVPESDFVYVYKIYNFDESDSVISYFNILGLDETNVSGMGYEDFGAAGAQPLDCYFDDTEGTEGAAWIWSTENGYIIKDGYSWMLVLSSDNGPMVRDYILKGPDDGDPLEGPNGDGQVPEPLTVALLGAGGAFLLRRKRR
ncbi:MAG: PEP-CTERM sorting domain-containing protein [Phycisphaerae bacterium]|jgi:hypothetical protein